MYKVLINLPSKTQLKEIGWLEPFGIRNCRKVKKTFSLNLLIKLTVFESDMCMSFQLLVKVICAWISTDNAQMSNEYFIGKSHGSELLWWPRSDPQIYGRVQQGTIFELSLSIDINCNIIFFIPLNKMLLNCCKTWDMIFI